MSLKKLTGGVACILPSPTRGHHSRIRLDNALAGATTLPCTIIPFAVTESMLVSPRCYRSVILHLEFFYPINIDRRVLSGYECRTLSLLFLSLPSCRLPPSLAHVGSVDSCVCTYFTDRLQAGDIWRIVVGFYRSRLWDHYTRLPPRIVAYSILCCFLASVSFSVSWASEMETGVFMWSTGCVGLLYPLVSLLT